MLTAHQQYFKLMTENKKLILSLGSNYDQERNIIEAISLLNKMFAKNDIVFSRQMWTDPVEHKNRINFLIACCSPILHADLMKWNAA